MTDPSQLIKPIADRALRRLRSTAIFRSLLVASAWNDLHVDLEKYLLCILRPIYSISLGPARHLRYRLRLPDLYDLFPDAEETVKLATGDWIKAQRRMLRRLKKHRSEILPGSSNARVEHIVPALSDRHNGETATMVQFQGGERLIYKPRPCDGERIWFSVLRWIEAAGFGATFQIPTLVARSSYAWMSFIQHHGCRSRKCVRSFYFKWGAQAALAELLGCSDLHRQNWIASGEHPVLVDAEMVGYSFPVYPKFPRRWPRHLHPLLKTGLLRLASADRGGQYREIAPFDARTRAREYKSFWPRYRNRTEPPNRYAADVVAGFRAMSLFIRNSEHAKVFEKFLRQANRRSHIRILRRSTVEYYRLLSNSLQPFNMCRRGQRLSYLLKRCGRGKAATVEALTLVRCSIPRFQARPNRQRRTRRTICPRTNGICDSGELLASRLRPNKFD